MNECELYDISIENAEDPPELEELVESEEQRAKLCWHCKKDVKENEFIHECNCKTVIHVKCLTEIRNTRKIRRCPHCAVSYPLKRGRMLSLKTFRKTCVPFLMITFSVLIILIIGALMFNIIFLSNDMKDQLLNILRIIGLIVFLVFIYVTGHKIINWSKELYNIYREWPESVQEWVYIGPNSQNIRETVV